MSESGIAIRFDRNGPPEGTRQEVIAIVREELGPVSLAPFPAESLGDLWAWCNEYPKANFDDFGPNTSQDLRALWGLRIAAGYKLIGVTVGDKFVGAIGFQPSTSGVGRLCGICFSKGVHGKGVAKQAVTAVLAALWAEGYRKVTAEYLVTNHRISHFLVKLGAVQEGYFKAETMQSGRAVDVRSVAFRPAREN